MPIERSEVRRVLLSEAKLEISDRVMAVLEPIIIKAETDVFRLDGRHAVSDEEIGEAVMSALNQPTLRVARISLSEGPFSKPHFMTLEFYRECLHSFLQQDVTHRLHYKLHDEYNGMLHKESSLFATEQNFLELLGKDIRCGLMRSVRATERHEKQWEDAWREAYRAIQTVLVCYICFAQMNDLEHMAKLEPLARIIHRVVPYGCKKFEHETRLVFVA